MGAQEHNVGTTPTADPDGGRLVVWRYEPESGADEMSYLPKGVNESGFPYTYSTTQGSYHMHQAGTVIVGNAVDDFGQGFIGKWTWNAGTSTWNAPVSIGTGLESPASWLPGVITDCGLPPQLTPLGVSDDGNTIVGLARDSTCGSFISAGFIWTASSGVLTDWYDYCVAQGVPGIGAFSPIDLNTGLPSPIGMPRIGTPTGISADGNAIIGQVLGPLLIRGAPPGLMLLNGGPGCVEPLGLSHPGNPTSFSACSSQILLSTAAGGTLPIGYQWYKDGSPLSDGLRAGGSTISGATDFLLRITPPPCVSA